MSGSDFYVTGGTLAPDAPSYLSRAADAELLDALAAGELCYILNARQMGKSSLCLRTRQALAARGIPTVFLDLQKFGSSATPDYLPRVALLGAVDNCRQRCAASVVQTFDGMRAVGIT